MSLPILQITKPNQVDQYHLTSDLTISSLANALVKSDLGLGTIGRSCIETLKKGQVIKTQMYDSKIRLVDVEVQVIYSNTIILK